MNIHLDNDMVSAAVKQDMPDRTLDALMLVFQMSQTGKLELVSSDVTRQEIERYQGPTQSDLFDLYSDLSRVDFLEDHDVLGFHSDWGPLGGVAWPLVEDNEVSIALRSMGLDRTDSHHLMLAIRVGCEVFLTCDRGIHSRRAQIEDEFTVSVMRPESLIQILGR